MIEVNLVPEVKREFLRSQKMRNLVISISIIVGIASIGVVVLLATILLGQKGVETLEDNAIKKEFSSLKSIEGVDDLVTIQNQYMNVSSTHSNKGINSRLLSMLDIINPKGVNQVKISSVTLSSAEKQVTIEGQADNDFTAADAFLKTIKNTKIIFIDKDSNTEGEKPLAENAQITDSSYGEDSNDRRVLTFSLSFTYSEELLSNKMKKVEVKAPSGIIDVTDSTLHVPESLFVESVKNSEEDK